MRVLMIDRAVKDKIADVIQYAHRNPFFATELAKMQERFLAGPGKLEAIGQDPQLRCEIPHGYRVVFSIDEHAERGWLRHLSVSVAAPVGALPSIEAMQMIAEEFGFSSKVEDAGKEGRVWIEHEIALNLVELYPDFVP